MNLVLYAYIQYISPPFGSSFGNNGFGYMEKITIIAVISYEKPIRKTTNKFFVEELEVFELLIRDSPLNGFVDHMKI